MVKITGNAPCNASGGISNGYGDGNFEVDFFDDGNGNGDGYSDGYSDGYGDGYGDGNGTRVLLYCMHPYARLTFWGAPDDDTFENFSLHLQVEQLVHRRV